jgi:hypothetical protein
MILLGSRTLLVTGVVVMVKVPPSRADMWYSSLAVVRYGSKDALPPWRGHFSCGHQQRSLSAAGRFV